MKYQYIYNNIHDFAFKFDFNLPVKIMTESIYAIQLENAMLFYY
jgi:hypothetical protein